MEGVNVLLIERIPLSRSRTVVVYRKPNPSGKRGGGDSVSDINGRAVMNSELPNKQLAEMLSQMPRVTRVEVVDADGHGIAIEN